MPSKRTSLKMLLQFLIVFLVLYLTISSQPSGFLRQSRAKQHTVSMQLSGKASQKITADRAVVEIRIAADGSNQAKVSDQVRSTTNEVLNLLRPLAELHPHGTDETGHPHVIDLSVNTLRMNSWKKDTVFGQAPVYKAQTDIEAEFTNFESLGVVLGKIAKSTHLSINSVGWKLSDELREKALFECREAAMENVLAKFKAYGKPLGLTNVRAVEVREDSHLRAKRASQQNAYYEVGYDEIVLADVDDRFQRKMWTDDDRRGAYEMESRTMEVVAEVWGTFEAH